MHTVFFFVADLMQDNFLMVTDSYRDVLYQYDLASRSVWRIPFSHQGYEMAFSYDHIQSKVYWTSYHQPAIIRRNLTGEDDGTFKNLQQCMCYIRFDDAIYLITIERRQSIPLRGNEPA